VYGHLDIVNASTDAGSGCIGQDPALPDSSDNTVPCDFGNILWKSNADAFPERAKQSRLGWRTRGLSQPHGAEMLQSVRLHTHRESAKD
jgi:hypothetical protein